MKPGDFTPPSATTPNPVGNDSAHLAVAKPRQVLPALRHMLGVSLSLRHPLSSTEALLDPLARIGSLWLAVFIAGEGLSESWLALSAIIAVLSFPSPGYLRIGFGTMLRNIAVSWVVVASVLAILGYLTGLLPLLNPLVLQHWLWMAPLAQFLFHSLLLLAAPAIAAMESNTRRAVIAGAGEQGRALAYELSTDPYTAVEIAGYFDDRSPDRLAGEILPGDPPLLGGLAGLPSYVAAGKANVVYLALPLTAQSRITNLLQALRDTTAEVCFVPDVMVADLLRGRRDRIGETPVVSLLESPFDGVSGLIKRLLDLIFGALLLIVTLPLLIVLALAVRFSSKGPVFIVQHRYDLNGEAIALYALRTTCHTHIHDTHLAPPPPSNRLGVFLRRHGLEKLPRLINVIQGRLSLIGPQPHGHAHNEIYRRIVKGHLIRHHVRTGITGWAQIHGIRSRTATLEHMKERVRHDFEYLRHWSLRLDLQIMLAALAHLFDRRL